MPALARSRELAASHRERLDGSGYPRGLGAAQLTPADRLLAAADVYHALTEARAHRAARSESEAALASVDGGGAIGSVRAWAGSRLRPLTPGTEVGQVWPRMRRRLDPTAAGGQTAVVQSVDWPADWQVEAREALYPYLGADVRVRVVVGPPSSVSGSVLEGFVYLDEAVPMCVFDRSARAGVFPWRLPSGPVLRIDEVVPRRRPRPVFVNPHWSRA